MIHREDMLELTRRMTSARSSISRIAGAYYDEEGYIDGTFNTHFLKLSEAERKRNLELAKTILLAETNVQLKDYEILETDRKPGSIWQLLEGIRQSELKNDALLDTFYDLIGEQLKPSKSLACYLYFGQYDIPVKGSDREWMEGSEEVYTYLLCTVSPLTGEYEPGKPEFGFLYPTLRERTEDHGYINIFEEDAEKYMTLKKVFS